MSVLLSRVVVIEIFKSLENGMFCEITSIFSSRVMCQESIGIQFESQQSSPGVRMLRRLAQQHSKNLFCTIHSVEKFLTVVTDVGSRRGDQKPMCR